MLGLKYSFLYFLLFLLFYWLKNVIGKINIKGFMGEIYLICKFVEVF